MDHAEIMAMMKGYYADMLLKTKSKIDKDALFGKENIANLQAFLNEWKEVIAATTAMISPR